MYSHMLTHDKLIKFLELSGYSVDKKGMCYGIASMGMQACLSLDMPTFIRRLDLLEKLSVDEFVEQLENAKNIQKMWHARAKKDLQKELREKYKLDEKKNLESCLSAEQKQLYYKSLSEAE